MVKAQQRPAHGAAAKNCVSVLTGNRGEADDVVLSTETCRRSGLPDADDTSSNAMIVPSEIARRQCSELHYPQQLVFEAMGMWFDRMGAVELWNVGKHDQAQHVVLPP